MAEVFVGSTVGAEGFSRKVAIKRVLPGYSDNDAFSKMFVSEAQITSQLQHPNIVSVLDFDRDPENRLFLVMELVEGKDLDQLASTGLLPFPVLIFVISEVLRGLGHAHDLPVGNEARGVVHRDISPHNVLLSWSGAVKVSDFGIAKARAASEATASVFIKGKPAYMSPEQANGQPLDGRSDLFAVGVMLWEMLVGRRLFVAEDTRGTLAAVLFGQIPRPRSLRGDIPKDLERVTMKMLERDLPARYPTAEHAVHDLLDCADAPKAGREVLIAALAERFPGQAPVRQSLLRQRQQVQNAMAPQIAYDGTAVAPPVGQPIGMQQTTPAAAVSIGSMRNAQTGTMHAPGEQAPNADPDRGGDRDRERRDRLRDRPRRQGWVETGACRGRVGVGPGGRTARGCRRTCPAATGRCRGRGRRRCRDTHTVATRRQKRCPEGRGRRKEIWEPPRDQRSARRDLHRRDEARRHSQDDLQVTRRTRAGALRQQGRRHRRRSNDDDQRKRHGRAQAVKRLIILLVVLLAAPAYAEQVGVVVTGDPTMQPALVKQIEGWLKKNGHAVVAVPLPSDAINTLVDCFVIEDEGCARGVIDKRGRANVIIYARVDVQQGGDIDKTVTVSTYWFEKGQKPIPQRKFCERCGEAALRTTVEGLLIAMVKAAPSAMGKIKVTANPAGAICAIDGKPIGPAPLDHVVAPGPHEVTVTRERHETETRFVTVKAGETATLDVALTEVKTGSRALPVATIGVGAALLVTGVVMLAIDQDKGAAEPLEIRNTGPTGAALAITGLAVATGGVVWYLLSGSSGKSSKRSKPTALITRDAAYVGWAGRF